MHRPPHSLAILTLDEVKLIDLFAQDTFFRHFDMYKFSLTVKDEMQLKQDVFFTHNDSQMTGLADGKETKYNEINELNEYFSVEEQQKIKEEQEYLLHGPGKIERILNEEMERLQKDMEAKIDK